MLSTQNDEITIIVLSVLGVTLPQYRDLKFQNMNQTPENLKKRWYMFFEYFNNHFYIVIIKVLSSNNHNFITIKTCDFGFDTNKLIGNKKYDIVN